MLMECFKPMCQHIILAVLCESKKYYSPTVDFNMFRFRRWMNQNVTSARAIPVHQCVGAKSIIPILRCANFAISMQQLNAECTRMCPVIRLHFASDCFAHAKPTCHFQEMKINAVTKNGQIHNSSESARETCFAFYPFPACDENLKCINFN